MLSLALLLLIFTIVSSQPPKSSFPYRISSEHLNTRCRHTGRIPKWLSGRMVRQVCGGFGPQGVPQTNPPTKIDHFFDCFGMVATFNFKDGQATFSNKFYDTHQYKVWQHFNYSLEDSKIAWKAVFSRNDPQQAQVWGVNWTREEGFYQSTANVNFWKIDGKVEAVDESPHGLWFDLETLQMKGPFPFEDHFEEHNILVNNPAHGCVDETGATWATVGKAVFTSQSGGIMQLLLYKIEGRSRVIQGTLNIGNFDLAQCRGDYRMHYPNVSATLGYLHSFSMTKDYVILPFSSVSIDYCGMMMPRPPTYQGPFFFDLTHYETNKSGNVVIFDKRSKTFVKSIPTTHFFASHQANAYQIGNDIVMDMVTYDYDIYQALTNDNILNGFPGVKTSNTFERFVVNTRNWNLRRTTLPVRGVHSFEFPKINEAFKTRAYRFVYGVGNVLEKQSSIIKYDLFASRQKEWGPFRNVYPAEPIFVPRPGSKNEDDGVLLVGIVDASRTNGYVVILDAQSLHEVARIEAPVPTPFGLHNYFESNCPSNVKAETRPHHH